MSKNNYGYEKRQKELNRQRKREKKLQRKLERKNTRPDQPGAGEGAAADPQEAD